MYLMYYAGHSGKRELIGLAISKDGKRWFKYPKNPILHTGGHNSWDEKQVSNPCVLFKNDKFHMWYQGKDRHGSCRIGYATSKDGIEWEKHGYVSFEDRTRENGSRKGRLSFQHPHVIITGKNLFHMWFTKTDSGVGKIYHAISHDGLKWRTDYRPVLNTDSEWEKSALYYPCVLYDRKGIFHMWYTGVNGKRWGIGYAKSQDGIHWLKSSCNPLLHKSEGYILTKIFNWERGVSNASVLYINKVYYMWYQNHLGKKLSIKLAISEDGIVWEKYKAPILTAGPKEWDSFFVADPFVIRIDPNNFSYEEGE